MQKLRGMSTTWIVVITTAVTLVIISVIALIWYSSAKLKKAEELTSNKSAQSQSTKDAVKTTKTPSETPSQSAENFLKGIFDSFSGSSVNLTKAKGYLSSSLQSKVNDTKESYWDLHGYIHSGPCRISVQEKEKSETAASIQISAEWGVVCNITDPSPYYVYKMVNDDGYWKITEIEQLQSFEEKVPRDF